MNRWLWAALAIGVVSSIVVAYRIAHLALVLGSEQGRWVYGYVYGFNVRSLVLSGIALVIAGAPLALRPDVVVRREWWLVVYCIVAGTFVQTRLRTLTPYSLARVFESDGSDGFYGATQQYRASVLLKDFERLRPTLTIHPRSNMPGKLAFVYALERLSLDPATLAMCVVVLSNLGGVVLYLLARELTGDSVAAMTALVFYLFVPGKLFFFPVLNTVTPAIVIACLYLWLHATRDGILAYGAALGVALYGMTVFDPLPLATGVVFAALGTGALVNGNVDVRTLGRQVAVCAASFVLAALAMRVWLHFDMPTVLKHVVDEAVAFNDAAGRPYRIWVWRNLVDFSIGTGLTQTLLFAAVLVVFAVSASREGEWGRGLWRTPIALFTMGVAAALAITDILGVNRGETVRLWIFFSCLVQVPAAYACARLRSRAACLATFATSIVIGALGTSMMTFAQP